MVKIYEALCVSSFTPVWGFEPASALTSVNQMKRLFTLLVVCHYDKENVSLRKCRTKLEVQCVNFLIINTLSTCTLSNQVLHFNGSTQVCFFFMVLTQTTQLALSSSFGLQETSGRSSRSTASPRKVAQILKLHAQRTIQQLIIVVSVCAFFAFGCRRISR